MQLSPRTIEGRPVKRIALGLVLAASLAACSSTPQGVSTAVPPTVTQNTPQTPAPAPTPSATPVISALIVCEFFTGRPGQTSSKSAHQYLVDASGAAITGGNEALPVREAITEINLIATHDADPTEKKDLTTLANTLDSVALSGGDFTDWDPAFEAFYVKYAEPCGQQIAQ
jgi:hypothetical protein